MLKDREFEVALVIGLTLLATGCGESFGVSDNCDVSRSCAAGGESTAGGADGDGAEGGSEGTGASNVGGASDDGSGGSAGDGGTGECEGDVSDDAACWTSNEYGVFVSNEHGDDVTGNGTRESPYKSITKGVASAGGKKIFVCLGPSGDYTEALAFDGAENVAIYGGFECENWEYSTTRKAGVKSAKNVALRINKSKNLTFENLRITSADATEGGYDASSYGAFVTDSQGVLFRRVEISAGKGAKGSDGAAGVRGQNGAERGESQNGAAGHCDGDTTPVGTLGAWPTAICGSKGGRGGEGSLSSDGANGSSGIPSTNVTPPAIKNFGLGSTDAVAGRNGTSGSAGNAGALGAAGPMLGTFDVIGYVGGNGKMGTDGFPGQGGGGGGASKGLGDCVGAGGGAGGMGGCGGTAGKGGAGGGASVGLVSWSSDVHLEGCSVTSLKSGAGGNGGAGGGGGSGAIGGYGGDPDYDGVVAHGGDGGRGGNGGVGGSGSGGTGGASFALVFRGAKPVYTEADTKLTPGVAGAGGIGGQSRDDFPKAPDGAAGVSGVALEISN